ncbi:MAG: AmmeMemoRadiSam system protein B [Anaerolineae bacterium]
MKNPLTTVILLLSLTTWCLCSCAAPTATPAPTPTPGPSEVRQPAVAGQFYPYDPHELARMVDAMLANVEPVGAGGPAHPEPVALIVPHAGYIYSGQVAAYAFKQIEGLDYEAIVVVGNNHRDPTFRDLSVYARGAFETPLGPVPIDEELAQALIEADERIVFDRQVHRYEHSIEVELPFLQRVCPSCKIVPIIVGQPSWENCEALADALARVLAGKHALIIASSDMSHYPAYEDAVRVDRATLAAIETLDPRALLDTIQEQMGQGVPNLHTCLCGQGPVLVAMIAARKLGANRVTVLKYANSGDTPFGDPSQVVGYGAVMFWRGQSAGPGSMLPPFPQPPEQGSSNPSKPIRLSPAEKARLLAMARETIARFLEDGFAPLYSVTEPELLRKSGAFVTLKEHGELRGCIGYTRAERPLYLTVQAAALAAAVQDRRFPPVAPEELKDIEIEISVLSPLRPISDVSEIQVGKHGLFIVKGQKSGLLLPQVATEQGWDWEQFLRGVCRKAGLPEDCWQKGAQLYVFTADVFGEE